MPLAPRFKRKFIFLPIAFCAALFLAACSSSEERAEEHYKRGLELVEEGEFTKAGLEFRNALKLKSDHVDALYAFGEVQERQGEFQSAFKIFNGVTEQDDTHLPSRLKLTYMLLTANQTKEAKKILDEAIAIAPSDPKVLIARATLELKLGNPEAAEEIAREALKADPEASDAVVVLASSRMMAQDAAGALAYLNQAPSASDNDMGVQALKLSVLEALNDEEGIESLFAELVERFPETPRFNQAWINWHLSSGRIDDAERVARKFAAARLEEDQAQLSLIALLNAHKGQDAARKELESIIEQRATKELDTFPLRMALGELMYRSDKQAEAIETIRSVVAATSGKEQKNQARIVLASMLVEENDIAQAESLVDEVLADDSKNVDALRLRAGVKLTKNDNAGAVDDILVALNEAPEDAGLRALLASAYERDGESILAEEQYAKALALDNNSVEMGLPMVRFLLRYGKSDQAERILETLRAQSPNNQQVLTLLAQQRLARQDWVGAQEMADEIRRTGASGTETADRITAAALTGLNRYEESIDLLQSSATRSDAGNEQALLSDLVRTYLQAKKFDAAIAHLDNVLEKDPNNTTAKVLLGSTYFSMNETDKAEEAFKSAAADANSVLGNTSLAQFLNATQRPDEAEEAIRTGLAKQQDSTALRLMLTNLLQQAGRFDEAIEEYEILFEADPESTIIANDLASLLSERRGDAESLERAFEIAQRFRTSEVPQYLDTLGWIYYLRGEYSSALPLLRSSSQELPGMGLVQFHYGMTLAALEQKDQAIESLEKALNLKTLMTEEDQKVARETIEELQKPEAASQ